VISMACPPRCGDWPGCSYSPGFALFAMWIYTTAGRDADDLRQPPIPARPPTTRGAKLGRRAVRRAYNGFGALAAVVIPADGAPVWPAHQPRGEPMSWWGPACLSFLYIRDPHWLLVSMVWWSALPGPRFCHCLMPCFRTNLPTAKMGRLHGHLQFLHCDPAIARRQRARSTAAIVLSQPANLGTGPGRRQPASSQGLCTLRVPEPEDCT